MNEAERYLEEKLNPPVRRSASPAQPPAMPTDTRVPSLSQTEPAQPPAMTAGTCLPSQPQAEAVQPRSTGTPAVKYVLAVFACLGVLIVGAMIAASIGVGRHIANRNFIGYVVMAAIFMAMIGTWKAITSKR